MTRRNKTLLALATLLVIAVVSGRLYRSIGKPPAPPSQALQSAPGESAMRSQSTIPGDDLDEADMLQETGPDFLDAINRYPPGNRRLTDDSQDLLNPGARHEQRRRIPNDPDNPDPGWDVLLTADRYLITGKETAEVTLQLWHMNQPVAPENVSMAASTADADRQKRRLVTRPLRTGVVARLAPDSDWPDYAGPVRVEARFSADGMVEQTGFLDFHFTGSKRNPGRFTGLVSDRLVNGDLVFQIEVDIFDPGRFRAEGNLFDNSGRPFGWSRFEGDLERGKQEISLTFDGLLFHDAQARSPFLLTQLRGYRLAPEYAEGRQSMSGTDLAHATQNDYPLSDFRDTVKVNPRQERLRGLYEEARRRGVKLTEPEYTGN